MSEILKKFKEESGIISNFKFAVCNAKKLDGEKNIKELDLKDMDIILVRWIKEIFLY